jgi:hypothetical protein
MRRLLLTVMKGTLDLMSWTTLKIVRTVERTYPIEKQDQQHIEILSDSPHGIPIPGRASADTSGVVSERTPLLQPPPPIPRLHEPVDDDISDIASAEQTSTSKMFREELHILTMYSLPVFGFVFPSLFLTSYLFFVYFFQALTFANTLSSWFPSYP